MRQGTPIHFVIPNGFKGPIQLPLDPVAGKNVVPTNGQFVYTIPADGLLRVKSFDPFRDWHKQTASYEDGTAIPNEYETWSGVIFHDLGESTLGNSLPVMHWFVGSKAEFVQWERRGLPEPEPLRQD